MKHVRSAYDLCLLAMPIFVRQVIVFPILVVLLAAGSFMLGGVCAAWQWWTALAVVMLFPFARGQRNRAVCADILFVVFLAGLYAWFSFCSDDNLATDYTEYHLSAIRLLIEGWNPVRDADMSAILSTLKLEPWDMRYLHVQFCEKAVWIFNAVAFRFFRQPYAVSISLNPFLEVLLLFSCVKFFRFAGWRWIYGVILYLATIFFAGIGWPVDDAVIYSSAVLLMGMTMSLRDGKLQWWELLGASFWLMNTKMSSLLFCFVFWVVFSVAYLWRKRGEIKDALPKLAVAGALLTMSFAIASWSPVGTSYVRYGHPLYPMMTSDAEKYPVMDITASLSYRNADAAMLGYWGNFVNAYVSPRMVRSYFNHKLGRSDFSPQCWEWMVENGNGAESGLNLKKRTIVQLSFLLLACIPGMRFLAIQFIVALFCIPQQYHGYLRYSAWIYFLITLSYVALAQKLLHKHRCLEWCAAALLLLVVSKSVFQTVLGIIAYSGEVEAELPFRAGDVYVVGSMDGGYSWTESRKVNESAFIERNGKNAGVSHPGLRVGNNVKLLLKELGCEDYNDARYFKNEFPKENLAEYHGGYFRKSESPRRDLSSMGIVDRVRYVLTNKMSNFVRQGSALLLR